MRAICWRAEVMLPHNSCYFSTPKVDRFNGWDTVPQTVVAQSSKVSRIV